MIELILLPIPVLETFSTEKLDPTVACVGAHLPVENLLRMVLWRDNFSTSTKWLKKAKINK